ncbi:SNF2-related protein [Terasakiella sp. A23]|uniref:SNF2-related protein n=1 Tax=Terasakiella sp. FCG-A23 TaxID=3080561 RepID=UPI002953543D|nr:SNF2-related protein [Terasakiella sp. A23]MDV7341577.1 SNF2-related protein [Terasakiella sp. A23]
MQITPFHAKYYAQVLSQKHGHGGVERLSRSLFDAYVDLNPHQIDAALFALRSPLSKGVILADEVGLGKTIESGLLLCQLWAERKRKLLIVCPASLRKQWQNELEEKFNLPSIVLDAKTARDFKKKGAINPFDQKQSIVITSYQYANRQQAEVRQVGWDLAVIDEAHKLRNVYQKKNKIGKAIKWALEDTKKVLLTATPLQNKLDEIFGLASLIDDRIFGHIRSFRSQYTAVKSDLEDLRERMTPFCHRTLRSQVLEYIRYTERKALTVPFTPTDDEQALYDAVSAFLSRKQTHAIPQRQKHLITLILRKLLASSTNAIIGTLEAMVQRLEALKENQSTENEDNQILGDLDIVDEYLDEEFDFEFEEIETPENNKEQDLSAYSKSLQREIDELTRFIQLAKSLKTDTKARSLLTALDKGFSSLKETNAPRKALIFTESRRTQDFLLSFLEENGFKGKIVLFNGTNGDDIAKSIYKNWLNKNVSTGRITGSRPVDVKSAIVEHFRDEAEIMIATEAGAEGINLQFCPLLINYDLPWNPQRVEQRIGRCHRYGQKHDVVVINFLNKRNEADQRVHQLLTEKFNLFSGVFGASDEVLGSLENGIDFEKRILQIYQDCRDPKEIEKAFNALQAEMDEIINAKMSETRSKLLEHFDEDVHSRLKSHLDETKRNIDRFGRYFWETSKHVLSECAGFDDDHLTFFLDKPPQGLRLETGVYHLINKEEKGNIHGQYLYRPSHRLGEYVIDTAAQYDLSERTVAFNITDHPTKISVVEALQGQSGILMLQRLNVRSFEDDEFLLFAAFTDQGKELDQEVSEKMFDCTASLLTDVTPLSLEEKDRLKTVSQQHVQTALRQTEERNHKHFNDEREKLDKWVRDVEIAAEKNLKDTKDRIRDLQREANKLTDLDVQLKLQEQIRDLERKKKKLRREIFDVQDEAEEKRDQLIDNLRKRMESESKIETLFTIRWEIR